MKQASREAATSPSVAPSHTQLSSSVLLRRLSVFRLPLKATWPESYTVLVGSGGEFIKGPTLCEQLNCSARPRIPLVKIVGKI